MNKHIELDPNYERSGVSYFESQTSTATFTPQNKVSVQLYEAQIDESEFALS